MLNWRKWQILGFISSEMPIDGIDPPLEGTELRFYEEHKAEYEMIKSRSTQGNGIMFVPQNDMDYDESDETWPPVYSSSQC